MDLAAIFANARPVEVEVGTGKGGFLLERAEARPEVNFLGIEYAAAYCNYAADRFRRAGLENVRMLVADAAHCFKVCLQPRSLLRVHVYFPDPWPKRRHHRRRLIQPAFVADARRTLILGGELIIVTDHADYFSQIERALAGAEGLAAIRAPAGGRAELIGTNFQRKYAAQGRTFYAIARMRYA